VEVGAFFAAKAERTRHPLTSTLFETTIGIDGPIVPTSDEFDHAICVIDDVVTGMVLPIGVCVRCHRVATTTADRGNGPIFLSRLRDLVVSMERDRASLRTMVRLGLPIGKTGPKKNWKMVSRRNTTTTTTVQ
jgi:hypothetical protein